MGFCEKGFIHLFIQSIRPSVRPSIHPSVHPSFHPSVRPYIPQVFGATVAGIVAEVTDEKGLPTAERKRLQVVNASKKSREAKLVKLADKLYNLRDLDRYVMYGRTIGKVIA